MDGIIHIHTFMTMQLAALQRLTGEGVPLEPASTPADPLSLTGATGAAVAANNITAIMILDEENQRKRCCNKYKLY